MSKKITKQPNHDEGFTLIEVLIAAAVSSVVGLAIASLLTGMANSNSSIKAHADFIVLQNMLSLLGTNTGCATGQTAFQDSTGNALAINLTNLPSTYQSIQTCTGASTCGVAIPQLALPSTGVILTGPATDGALGANYTGATPVSPSNITITDLRISDVIGTPPVGPGGTAQVHLHIGATVAVGGLGNQGVGNNFMTANIPIQLTTNAANHVIACGTSSCETTTIVSPGVGYQRFCSGVIMQWTTFALSPGGNANSAIPFSYPIPFPNNVYSVTGVDNYGVGDQAVSIVPVNLSGGNAFCNRGSCNVSIWAVGN